MKGEEKMTITLGNLVEICLGKVILKEDIAPAGNAKVAGISNMSDQGLLYEEMESAYATPEDLEKYAIRNNDVLITCRGTKFRSVLVENKLPHPVIASGNLMIIRCEEVIDAAVIHLYLQSPIGEAAITQLNPGKNTINIGKKQLQSLEVPTMSIINKEKIVHLWKQGREKYGNTICEAQQEWTNTIDQLNGYLAGIDEEDQPVSTNESQRIRKKKIEDRLLIEWD